MTSQEVERGSRKGVKEYEFEVLLCVFEGGIFSYS